jgi:endonuclease-3
VEKGLVKYIPQAVIPKAHHWLILHGRYICVARSPKCHVCPLTDFCAYYAKEVAPGLATAAAGKPSAKSQR